MASGFRGFVGSDSPRDNPTHVKEGYSFEPPGRVTLPGGGGGGVTFPPWKQALRELFHTKKWQLLGVL